MKHENNENMEEFNFHGHSWKILFKNANSNPVIRGENVRTEKYNYFIGNDSVKWAGNVSAFNSIEYNNLYNGIDLNVYSSKGNFKYDFIVAPNINPSLIVLEYKGIDKMKIKEGNLILSTSIGFFTELSPYSYQIINGLKKEVKCNYVLKKNSLSFEFPEGYDTNYELIIDPILVAATLSGSTSHSFGHTATYDNSGNIYTGAVAYGNGYPTTIGAFQTTFTALTTNIAISKFSPDGSTLIYSSYIGGGIQDRPHSLIVNDNEELFIYGTSRSIDYPTTVTAYNNSHNSGSYDDIVITHLNSSGSSLIGSTYIGGSYTDGINNLTLNYGDKYRGEIILDNLGNCYVTSFTRSNDFPTTAGAYQNSYGGLLDGVVFSMSSDLSTLNWSTYIGSTGDEVAFGLKIGTGGEIYVCGATNNQFITATGYQTTFQGNNDAFVIKFNSNCSSILSSTYWGTPANDEAFFVDLDDLDNVYIYGLSDGGTSPVSTGVYSNPNSAAFITKMDNTLTNIHLSSVIGDGTSSIPFVPIAFMVDNCGYIYTSGHSAENNLTISTGALQTSGGFYVSVYEPDFTALNYATYYGGQHVDGGTSRFDPKGIIYQAVCTNSSFNTTPGAYSSTFTGWDIGVFKIDFQTGVLNALSNVTPSNIGCAPFNTSFINNSNGTNYEWDFGDGSPISNLFEPTHTYTTPGTYNVRLIAYDSTSCVLSDTAYLSITVHSVPTVDLGNDTLLCSGTIILDALNVGLSYTWQDGSTNQTLTVSSTGIYTVEVDNGACSMSDTINVIIETPFVGLGPDITTCDSNVLLNAQNTGLNYLWSDGTTNQTNNVTTPGIYWVEVSSGICTYTDTIEIFKDSLTVLLPGDTLLCQNHLLVLDAQNSGANYQWSTGEITQNITAHIDGIYSVIVNDGICSAYDTIEIQYYLPDALFSVSDTIGCPPVLVNFNDLSSTPIDSINSWHWSFGDGDYSTLQNPSHLYYTSDFYDITLQVTTTSGCQETFSNQVYVTVHPEPIAAFTYSPTDIHLGDEVCLKINQ